jgi:hypothetical protein
MSDKFQSGDSVIVNAAFPYLADQSGAVQTPDYMGYVTVVMDNNDQLCCFLPEELDRQEDPTQAQKTREAK